MARNTNVDILKGVGIVLVVIGHEIKGLLNSNMLGSAELLCMHIYDFIYIFHMPLFFFLSGFLYYNVKKDTSILDFIKIKFASLYIPYLIFMVIRIVSNVLMNEYVNHEMAWSDIYSIFYKPISVYWFLLTLFKVSVFIFLIDKLFRNNLRVCLSILIIMGALYTINNYNNLLSFFEYVFIFYSGKMMHKHIIGFSKFNIFLLMFLVVLSYFIFIPKYQALPALFIILLLYKAIDLLSAKIYLKINQSFSLLGRQSMVIYLTHVFFLTGTRIIIVKVFDINSILLHFLIGILVGVIVPILTYQVLYKVKLVDFMFYPNKYLQLGKCKA